MKKTTSIVIAILLFFIACTSLLDQRIRPNYKIVDHKGVLANVKVPALIKDAMTETADVMAKKYFPNSYVFVANQKGRNLDGLTMWAQNFTVQAEVAKRIQTNVDFVAKNSVHGNKDSVEKAMDVLTEVIAKESFSGLQKQQDWWIKLQYEDGQEEFQYIAVYAIDKTLLDKFMDDAIEEVANQQELNEEIKGTLAQLRDELKEGRYGLEDNSGELLSEAAFDASVADSE